MRSTVVATILAVALILTTATAAGAGGKGHGKGLANPGKAKSILNSQNFGTRSDQDRFRVVHRFRKDKHLRVRGGIADDFDHDFRGLPPGLGKRHTLPPGLAKRTDLPPGLAKWHFVPPGLAKKIELPPGLSKGHTVPPGLDHQSGFSVVIDND